MSNDILRNRLKVLTKPFHDSLEATPLAISLASGNITKDKYISFLKDLYYLHKEVESKMCLMPEWSSYKLDPHQHTRADLLLADLAAFGVHVEDITSNITLIDEYSFAKIIGMLYVLEGSTMGGRVLSQRLLHVRGNDDLPVTRYYNAYADETMQRWGEYCSFLSEYEIKHPEDSSEIILGACSMFLQMEEILLANN